MRGTRAERRRREGPRLGPRPRSGGPLEARVSSWSRVCGAAILCWGLAGCSFLETATEITAGEGMLPRFSVDSPLPTVDEIAAGAFDELPDTAGLPLSLDGATLAHLRGALVLDGRCELDLPFEVGDERVQQARLRLRRCELEGPCRGLCAGEPRPGLAIEALAELELLDSDTAQDLRDLLSEASEDAIVQIRLRFFALALEGAAATERLPAGTLAHSLELAMALPGGEDELVVVPAGFAGRIAPTRPARFELDPAAALTRRIRGAILGSEPLKVEFVARLFLPRAQLFEVELSQATFKVDLQPEIVLSALEAARAAL